VQIEPLSPFGAEIRAFDTAQSDAATGRRIVELVASNRVLVLRDQQITARQFVDFLRTLGPMTFTAGEIPVEGAPDLNLVTNVGRARRPRSVFHTDTSYVEAPPAISALRVVDVPDAGGATLFSDQVRAFAALSDEKRATITGRTARHAYTDANGRTVANDQPLVLAHPITGERSLYLSTPERISNVGGLDRQASRTLIEGLYEHSQDEAHLYRHDWRVSDIVMWDNRVTMHRADHSAVEGDRTLHRGLIAGTPLIPAG